MSRVTSFCSFTAGVLPMASNTEFRTDKGFVMGLVVAATAVLRSFFDSHTSARMATLYASCEAGFVSPEKGKSAREALASQTKVWPLQRLKSSLLSGLP